MIALDSSVRDTPCSSTVPPTWPEQFVIVQRRIPDDDSGNSTTTTFYDFVRQANLIWIAPDSNESAVLWDLELGSGHSYYFTPTAKSCMRIEMPVGVLKPNWLENSTSLGERTLFGKRACGWTKVDFIDYWADASDGSPISWYFHTMKARFDTVYFAPGAQVPSPSYFVPPSYCNSSSMARRSKS